MKTPKQQLPYIKPRKETAQLLVFSVTPFKTDQNKLKTIRQIKSRIQEMKGGKCTKTLAKIQVEGIIRIRDVRRNDLPKFIEIYVETPCWCPSGMSTNMADGNQQKHLLPSFATETQIYSQRNSFKVILFSNT